MASKQHFTKQANGLYNGVTTQPDVMRQDTQADEQINFLSDLTRGLESRNGTKLINGIQTVYTKISNNSLITKIDKDTRVAGNNTFTDDYIVVFTGIEHNTTTNPSGGIEIFDKNGVKQRLLNPDGTDYLITSNPRTDIKTTLIEDYLVVANSTIDTAMDNTSAVADTSTGKALVVIEALHPDTEYTVTVDGTPKTFTTDASPTMEEIMNTGTGLVKEIDDISGYSATSDGNVIIIEKDSGSIRDIVITVTDAHAGTAIRAINGEVTKASDLPDNCIDGYVVNVTGVDEQNHLANYWLKFDNTTKVWKETVQPGLKTAFDATTMPHFLIKTGVVDSDSDGYDATLFDGAGGVTEDATVIDAALSTGNLEYKAGVAEFKFVQAGQQASGDVVKLEEGLFTTISSEGYKTRKVGDADSNMIPSIIGKPIMDLTFYRNRLVYLGQDSVVMSKSNDYFNLWNESAIGSFPTDPIDIVLGSNYIARPKYLSQYQGALLVFTENQQFILSSGEEALSPQTIRAELFTEYGTAENVHPVKLGEQLYFADTLGDNAVIRRYQVTRGSLVKDATDITAHVGTYIPKDIKFMFTVPNKNMLFISCISEPKTLYVYSSYTEDGEQIQSSWSKFEFGFDIFGAVVFDNTIYFVDKSGEMINISQLDLFETKNQLQVDQFVNLEGTYNIEESTAADGSKEFSLPFIVRDDNSLLCFVTVNNELINVHSTVLTELERADSSLGTWTNTSKAAVPTLTDYVPEKITLSNSYLPIYNGEYIKTDGVGNAAAYRKADNYDDVIIDYNTTTNHYEIKGLGRDINFPDFVADADADDILPAEETGSGVDNNTWKINLNIPNTGAVERDVLGNFVGSSSGITGNYIEIPYSLDTENAGYNSGSMTNYKINMQLYLDTNSPSGVGVFSSRNKNNEGISLIRIGETRNCALYLNSSNVNKVVYIDNLFKNEWLDFEFQNLDGKVILKINGVITPIFDKDANSFGIRKEIESLTAVAATTLTSTSSDAFNIMSETGRPTTAKGYLSSFKITKIDDTTNLEFDGDEGASSNSITVYSNSINDRGIYIEDNPANRNNWLKYKWIGTSYSLEWKQSHDYTDYRGNKNHMAWYITETSTGSVIAYYPEPNSSVGSDPTYIPSFGYIKPGDNYTGSGRGTVLENGYVYTRDPDDNTLVNTDNYINFDTTGYDYKDNNKSISYNINTEHNVTNNFKITLRGSFAKQDNEETYYCNHSDSQGILREGTISIGQFHNGANKVMGVSFLGLNNPNHKVFEHRNPNQVFFWKHSAPSGKKIENFMVKYIDTNQIKSTIDWGDDTETELTDATEVDKTYTEATSEDPYINGTEYLYFNDSQLPAVLGSSKKFEIKVEKADLNSTTSNVSIWIDNVGQTLYTTIADAVNLENGLTHGNATINSYDGFSTNSSYPRLMAIDKYIFSAQQLSEKIPPSVKNVTAIGKLNSFRIETNTDSKDNEILNYSFVSSEVDNVSYSIDLSTKHDAAGGATFAGSSTDTSSLHLEMNDSDEEYTFSIAGDPKYAPVDSAITKLGSKVVATTGTNGIMRLNPILKYVDCWATTPRVSYYPRKISFGYPTQSSYSLSPIFVTKSNRDTVSTGRFNLKALEVSFQEAVNFELQIEPKDRDAYIKEYSSKVGQTQTDSVNVTKGVHKFGINSSAKGLKLTIKNNSPYRSRFTGIAYEGTFINRSNIK